MSVFPKKQEPQDCIECPLYKLWGITHKDGLSTCYIIHRLEDLIEEDDNE